MMNKISDYITNPIKKHIIGKLMTNESLKYSQLQPKKVDNVLFNYHLQHLVKLGILNKDESIYSLSELGKQMTSKIDWDGVYFEPFENRCLLYLINGHEVLYNWRQRNPWFGDIMAISGKLPKGKSTVDYAKERLLEKTGLNSSFEWIGTLRKVVKNQKNELLNDMYYHICISTSHSGNLINDPFNNEKIAWISFDEAIEYEHKNKSAGLQTIKMLERFKAKDFSHFCEDEEIKIDKL